MTGDIPKKIFRCETFDKYQYCPTDCVSPKQWTVDCYDCQGDIKHDCTLCQGSGKVTHKGCPRQSARDVQSLLPYYYAWISNSGAVWPDGRGMLYQPLKLRRAFELLAWFFQNKEQKKAESEGKK